MNSEEPVTTVFEPDLAARKRDTIESFLRFAEGREIPAWPLELFLEISNVCNLKCAMCSTFSALNPHRYSELKMADRGFIDLQNVQSGLDTLLQHALNVHCFGYGEPTVHPDFRNFLTYISRYRVMIDFFTNGMYLTPELCTFLVDKRVERVTVSFSGVTKEEYENVYLGGVYETVLRGIESLAAEKARQRSAYPLIEINSLSFEHHVQQLDRFVDFMADHGVNVIHLKRLQTQFTIPQLKGHEAALRPWIEGTILDRAHRRAKARGIVLSAAQFQMTEVKTDVEWQEAKAQQGLPTSSASATVIPISDFKRLSRESRPPRPPEGSAVEETDVYHEVPAGRVREYLGIKPAASATDPFHCMEPFKTLYVRRNGFVKPCCFANDRAPALGLTTRSSGAEIWRGPRYEALRTGILNNEYPEAACTYCLRHKIGPRRHSAENKIDAYLAWYRENFGEPLMPSPVARLRALGDNRDIAERFLRQHPVRRAAAATPVQPAPEHPLRHPWAVKRIAERITELNQQGHTLEDVVQGHLDGISGRQIFGWVWSPLFPRKRFNVALYDFETEIGIVTADHFRRDLQQAGKHDGRCGFAFEIPEELFDGCVHGFRARLLGTDFFLRSAPMLIELAPPLLDRSPVDAPA